MIELLVVVTIIAVLAGLLLPVISVVRAKVYDVQDGNQLQQIAGAITVYQDENDELWPGSMSTLFIKAKGGVLEKGLEKILISPVDQSRGVDPWINRSQTANWGDYTRLHNREEFPTSYGYAMCDVIATADEMSWMYDPDPTPTTPVTWADGKTHQLNFGNAVDSTGKKGDPFPPDYFPTIRCYYHNHWTKANSHIDKKVINVSWNLSIFKSTSYWEHDVNEWNALPP